MQIEKTCVQLLLTQTMKGSLKSIAANTHWHYKSGKEKGVLEITLMKATREIILNVHENRKGDWQEKTMKQLHASWK